MQDNIVLGGWRYEVKAQTVTAWTADRLAERHSKPNL